MQSRLAPPCTLALGLLVLSASLALAANMTPVQLSGFNRDLVVESTSSGPPYTTALELNPNENRAFYQSGLPGKSYGLPASGTFTSALGDGTTFQFQPYTGSNAFVMSSGTGVTAGTLYLIQPAVFSRLAVLANSASGGGSANLAINFLDGSTATATYNAPDWFNNANFALQGFERIVLSSGNTEGAPSNPRLYQTTIDLTTLPGGNNKAIASITFEKVLTAGSTAVYAVSGELVTDLPPSFVVHPASTNVAETYPALFAASAIGYPSPTYQWYRDSQLIAGATQSSYLIPSSSLADHGAKFRVTASSTISNSTITVTSAVATLTVRADTNPPVLITARSFGLNQVQLFLSERVTTSSATNLANYSLSGGGGPIPLSGATLAANQSNLLLEVSTPLAEGATYQLLVNGLRDLSAAANQIGANSSASFVAIAWIPEDVGGALPLGGPVWVPGGVNVLGGGTQVGGATDQFQFSQNNRTGDFDFSVRLDTLTLTDPWAQAGLMARESLVSNSRFAAVFATPSISGCFFESRATTAATSIRSGFFPANYPNMFLRLARTGDQFTGYASIDGTRWSQLGTTSISLPATLYFGYAVSSRNTNSTTLAAFRSLTDVTSAAAGPVVLNREPLGQASRRTSLVLSEIMYHPPDQLIGTNKAELEFVELFNSRGEPEDIGGFRLSGDIDFVFPQGTVIPGGGFLVVARSPADLAAVTGFQGALGPWDGASTNSLPNSKGRVRLQHRTGAVLLDVHYDSSSQWPASTDGAGHSLVLARPSYGQDNPLSWQASTKVLGSPGRLDPFLDDPLSRVRINEFLAHTDDPDVDYIELYNQSTQTVSLAGCSLSDDPDLARFIIPSITLPPGGLVHFTQSTLGFALSAEGETIYFRSADGSRVIDAVRFQGQENGVSTGRWPDGADQFYRMTTKTPGVKNSGIRTSTININEIMYDPISGNRDDQFVELYNSGPGAVDLAGWRLEDGISYTFPSNTVLAANSYFVVARNALRLRTNYPALNLANCVGNFSGSLAGSGERVALSKPDQIAVAASGGRWQTNTIHIVVDEVSYTTGGAWPKWADRGGSSLELIDPRADRRMPSSWMDSDESTKAPWTLIERRGIVDNGNVSPDQLQVLLLGAGECLIDNVEVVGPGDTNRVANSTFELNASGWTAQGTKSTSGWETTEGYNSQRSYHVRALDRGDNQINRIRIPLTTPLTTGDAATIRARVRWLKGHPEVILRLRGNWLEASGTMSLPPNPGTPGERNSRALGNAPPAIHDVNHTPVLPGANEPAVVTGRVHDPDAVANLSLVYRVDPSGSTTTVTMRDDGLGGDSLGGDGLFSATIPGQPAGTLVAFYLQATDQAPSPSTARYPADAPNRECLVRFGETVPTGNLPVYRIWMTQNTFTNWAARPKLDNTPNNVTFVLSGHRVIHGAQALFAGSPYISGGFNNPAGNRCGYSISFPVDDAFLGGEDLVLDWPGGHGNENTALQEQMAYFIADRLNLPFSHRYHIRLLVNGVTDMQRGGVFEAVLQPAGDYLEQWNDGDADGEFYKIDRGFEFNDNNGLVADPMPRLTLFTTIDPATGAVIKKMEKYRWTWLRRSYQRALDCSNLLLLVDALNATGPEPYTSQTDALMDINQVMGTFAFEHIINNFDSWGHEIGKNMYFYKPENGRWQLYPFDLDWLMLVSPRYSSAYAGGNGPLFNSDDPAVSRLYSHPPFLRAYLQAVQNAANGPLLNSVADPVMDAKYASLVANGITMCDGQALANPSAVKQWFQLRRTSLLAQLATFAAPFTVTGSTTIYASSNTITLTGTAPIGVCSLAVNGTVWPITWTTVTNWTIRLPVGTGTNQLTVTGLDSNKDILPGASTQLTVVFPGRVPPPTGSVVISEIMANPQIPDAEYLELYNTSAQVSFDLSGFVLNGIDYTFPAGTLISPRSTLLLVKDRLAFSKAHGSTIVPFGQFSGNLQGDGETLTFRKPGLQPDQDMVVAQITYGSSLPWPNAVTNGSALQLRDPSQNNWRPANWMGGSPNQYAPPEWQLFSTNFTATTSVLHLYLSSAGDIYLDDIRLTRNAGPNVLTNGDFESPLGTTWNVSANFSQSSLSTEVRHGGNASLHMIATAGGTGSGNSISQLIGPPLTTNQTYTLSFWYLQSTNGGPFVARLSSSSTPAVVNPAPPLLSSIARATPGETNSVFGSLSQFPSLWINELQAENLTGITNSSGQRTAWLELFNPSTNTVSLRGLYLSTSYANLTQWAFPTNLTLGPGQFKVVFADGQTNLSTPGELHATFSLNPRHGSLVLSRVETNSQPHVLDYVDYANLLENRSWGSTPDAQSFTRQTMFYTTPGASNNLASAPLVAQINEWMADNLATLADPADGDYEDWFEIYNPGSATIDLGGYYLTDDPNLKLQYQVPSTGRYTIPPGGFLLVWADGETSQNSTNRPDLHVPFKLARDGEAIGLFAADETPIDYLTFGPQTSDLSQGRSPDGSASVQFLPWSTPRTNNAVINTRPLLQPIPDRYGYAGQAIQFYALAMDAETPPQTLSFSLDPGAPADAAIATANGAFTWIPSAIHLGTNSVTVRVTDNGVPPLDDARSFKAIVLSLPDLGFAPGPGGTITFSWTGLPGKAYRIQYQEELGSATWFTLGPDQWGNGGTLSAVVNVTGSPERFYRLAVIQ